jgi:hypothetical protein
MAEKALVQDLCVPTSASQPRGDGGLSKAENPLGSRRVQPFGQCSEHQGDLVRGGFQTVQGGVMSSTKGGAAGLTTIRLNPLAMAMLAIANQGMNGNLCDPEVQTLLIRTGKAFGVYPFGGSSSAFHLTPGTYRRRIHN